MKASLKVTLILFLGVLGVSFSPVLGRITTANGLVTAMYRMLMVAALLLPVVLLRHRQELRHTDRRRIRMCIVSGIFLGCHFAVYLISIKNTSIASGTVLVNTEVLFVALEMLLFFGKRLKTAAAAAIGLALAGSVIIAMGDQSSAGGNVILGDGLALLAAFCSSAYTLIGMREREGMSTTVYTFIVYGTAALTLAAAAAATGQRFTGYPAADYLSCLGMAVLCTLMGHSLFNYCLKYLNPVFITTAKLLQPVFATLLGILIFAEYPTGNQLLGGAVVIGGILLYVLKGREEG